MQPIQKYLQSFKRLRLDRSHGVAPHKPILLLSVLQAYQNNLIQDQRIYITPELVALFKANWNVLVTSKHDCRISYPFYYLKSDKFWKLIPKLGFDNLDRMGSLVKSFSNLNAALEFALIENDLFLLAIDKKSNAILQQFLLDEYFPETKNRFVNNSHQQLELFESIEGKILNDDSVGYRKEIKDLFDQNNEEEIFIRGSLFKREIPKIYNNTCCISEMKVDSIINVSMIDACHIIPFSISFDDTVTNGIALCPNLHRAFDRGLIAIDEQYKVIVSGTFKEDSTNYSIKSFEGKELKLPNMKSYYPLKDNFDWHRNNVFKN